MTASPRRLSMLLALAFGSAALAQPKLLPSQALPPKPPPPARRPDPTPKPTPITGEVVDDENGQPVDRYLIMEALIAVPGQKAGFQGQTMASFDKSTFTFDRHYRTGGHYWTVLRISAPGYAPFDTEPVLNDSQGNLKIRLKRAQTTRIPVKMADGSPVANGIVAVVDLKGSISLHGKSIDGFSGASFTAPLDDASNAAFTAPSNQYGGIVLCDEGYAIFESGGQPATLTITPWATINITVDGIGEPSLTNRPIIRFLDRHKPNWIWDATGISFKNGQAQLANRFSGDGDLEMYWMTANFRPGESMILDHLTLKPGDVLDKTYTLSRTTVSAVLDPDEDAMQAVDADGCFARIEPVGLAEATRFVMPKDIEQWPTEKVEAYAANWEESPEGKSYLAAKETTTKENTVIRFHPNADHSLVAKHVPSGPHMLRLEFIANQKWVHFAKQIDVPDADQLDLGTLKITVPPDLKLNEPAPEIQTPMLSGNGEFRLSDHRGKVIVLDFWGTACGPCVRQMPELRKLYDEFASTGQFEMVSLAGDDVPITAYAFVRSHGYNWTHVYTPNYADCKVVRDYQLLGVPALFVIAKDGKLLKVNPTAEQLRPIISAAIAEKTK